MTSIWFFFSTFIDMFARLGHLLSPKKIKAVKALQFYCFKIYIKMFLSSTLRTSEWSLSSGFATEILYGLSASHECRMLDPSLSCRFYHPIISDKTFNPYPTAFPYGNGMVLHLYQQQESSTTKTVHKVINKGLKTYV